MLKFENDKHSLDHEDRGLEIAVPLSVIIKVLPVSASAWCLCTLHVAVYLPCTLPCIALHVGSCSVSHECNAQEGGKER